MIRVKNLLVVILMCVFIAAVTGTPVFGQEQSQPQKQEQSEEDQKMMKIWLEYSTPGQNHKHLEYFAGNWEITAKMWMKPGTEPFIDKGESEARMILGGRYLYTYQKGTMMGIPAEGVLITGYDNYKKKFNTLWIDNAGTGFYPISGTLDDTGKIRTDTGIWDDVMTGGKMNVKAVTRIIDNDNYSFDLYMIDFEGKGGEFKSMESVYTRKK